MNSELNTTTLNKISLTNTIRSRDATSHTNPLTTEKEDGQLREDLVKIGAQALDGNSNNNNYNLTVPPLADDGHQRSGTVQHTGGIDDISAIAVPST